MGAFFLAERNAGKTMPLAERLAQQSDVDIADDDIATALAADLKEAPIVVVGNGPAGMRTVRELLDRAPGIPIVVYGEERYPAYNRARLSHLLAGHTSWDQLPEVDGFPKHARVQQRLGIRIVKLCPHYQAVVDSQGYHQPYSRLVLATGSSPHVPNFPGLTLEGVYTFRNLDDTLRLIARQARSHRTIVLGGGLLGIEAAVAMQKGHTEVTLIEHSDRLLGSQLDEAASATLEKRLESQGIQVIVGDGVKKLSGQVRVEQAELLSGQTLAADTVILATGIRPRLELVQGTGIAFGRGIRVDDAMQTTLHNVFAVGECAEHRGRIFGLVAPGLEQAAVAANSIVGNTAHYSGSLAASRLKVADCPVFSSGSVGEDAEPSFGRNKVFQDDEQGIYRRLVVHRWHLTGAIGVGPWDEDVRLQQAVARRQRIWPWQLWRFKHYGRLWPESEDRDVTSWPATATVCQCTGVCRSGIDNALGQGATTVSEVSQATGAGTVCGSCRPLIQDLVGAGSAEPEPHYRPVTAIAFIAALLTLIMLLAPAIPYPDSVQVPWRWDELWRDGFIKQVTGFSVLGLFAIGLIVSPRKRLKRLQSLGNYDLWRIAHMALGLIVIGVLIAHTGGRLGHGLNFWLMLAFGLTLLLGAAASGVIGQSHRLGSALGRQLRRQSIWMHILLFWPVPVLLGFHVLKGYWF